MKDYLSAEAKETLNALIQDMFQGNSKADNLVYNLHSLKMYESAKVLHENIAHVFGQWSDMISSEMDLLGCKAERRALTSDTEVYSEPIAVFRAFVSLLENTRAKVLSALEVLDYDMNNKEICLMLEDLARNVLKLLYKSNQMLDYAEYYNAKEKMPQFDFKVDDFFED